MSQKCEKSAEIAHLCSYFTSHICGNCNLVRPFMRILRRFSVACFAFSVKTADEQKRTFEQTLYISVHMTNIARSAKYMTKLVKSTGKIATHMCVEIAMRKKRKKVRRNKRLAKPKYAIAISH